MAFNNMDSERWKVILDRCLEQVERDVGDLIIQEVQEENENRIYANIPDLNEPYDDGHGHNTIETPKNDDHNSNCNDSIETSENDNVESSVLPQVFISVESSGLPQVVVSAESSGSVLPQDNLHVSVESSENDTLRFVNWDDVLSSICQKLAGVGKEEEDTIQESQFIEDQSNMHMDFEVILEEIFQWMYDRTGLRFEKQDIEIDQFPPEYEENRRKAYYYLHQLISSFNNNGAKKESESDDDKDGNDSESESDDGSQDNLHDESNKQNDSIGFEKLDIDQKQKDLLNIHQQSEGAYVEVEDMTQKFQITLKEEKQESADQRQTMCKLLQDFQIAIALEDRENKRRAKAYLQEIISSYKNSSNEESTTEESDEENDSSDDYYEEESDEENCSSYDDEEGDEENDFVTNEMYYSCDAMSDISDDEDIKSESSSGIVGTIWDRVLLAKSPDFCDDNKVASEKPTVESDGNEASEPEEIDEMSSAWRNPIIISSSSSDSDADLNTSMESNMEDIHLTDDEFEQTWEFINPKEVHSVPSQQQKQRSIKERILSLFGRKKMAA